MNRISATLLVICLSCMGCRSNQAAPQQAAVAEQIWPTTERPIVLNVLDQGGGLIFGGPNGTLGIRLLNANAFARYAISADAQAAACVSLDHKRTKACWVTFFDRSGKVLGNVMLPPSPEAAVPIMLPGPLGIQLSNRGEAIVTITWQQYYEGPARPGMKLRNVVERYYVLSDGTVKPMVADKKESIWYLFPQSGGIVMLRTSGEPHLVRPWQVERYDKGLQLRWRRQVLASYLGRLKPKHDFSLLRGAEGREFLHFRQDGTCEVEQPPHD